MYKQFFTKDNFTKNHKKLFHIVGKTEKLFRIVGKNSYAINTEEIVNYIC